MRRVILHCPRRGRFHFGLVALGENMSLSETALVPHSDTLFSAVINTAARVAPDRVEELIDAFRTGAINLSSGNFCLEVSPAEGAEQWIYFLPKPAHVDLARVPPPYARKDLHRIRYLSERTWLAGDHPVTWLEEEHYVVLPGGFVITREEAAWLPDTGRQNAAYEILDLPKVRVHHNSQDGGYFNQTSVQLNSVRSKSGSYRAHYHFFVENKLEGDLSRLFQTVLDLLPDQGLGGERRTGCGTIEKVALLPASPVAELTGSWRAAISLISPANATELANCAYYQPVLRGGRRIAAAGADNVHLQRVRMLREGCVLTGPVAGSVVDISPAAGHTHPYLRSGRCLSLPLHPNLCTHDLG